MSTRREPNGQRPMRSEPPRSGAIPARPVAPLDPQRLDNQLCFAVYAAAHAFGRAYRTLLAEHDLTYPQYLALLVVGEEEGLTVKEIGTRLFLDSGTLTPLLKRLEGSGHVRRAR